MLVEIGNRLRLALADDLSRRLARNLSYLFSANAIVSVIGFLMLGIAARALGPAGLGILALIDAYVSSVDLFLRFEPSQAVLRYGTAALEERRDVDFQRLIKFSTYCDFFGGMFAAIVAMLGASIAAGVLGFDAQQTQMLVCFAATLLFSFSSTSVAVLRIFDKFDLSARTSVIVAITRLIAYAVVWILGGGLWSFVVLMTIFQIGEQVTLLALSWRELGRHGHGRFLRTPLAGLLDQNKGLISFIFNANINVVARNCTQRFDILIIGGILGPVSAGFYQLAKRIGLMATKFAKPVQQAIYPEIARMWARGDVARFRTTVLGINVVLAAGTILVLGILFFYGELLVRLYFGAAFVTAVPLIIVQAVAAALLLSGTIFGPALLSMGEHWSLLRVTLLGTTVFFLALVPAVHSFGALGGSLVHVLFNLILLAGYFVVFTRRTKAVASGRDRTAPAGLAVEAGSDGGPPSPMSSRGGDLV